MYMSVVFATKNRMAYMDVQKLRSSREKRKGRICYPEWSWNLCRKQTTGIRWKFQWDSRTSAYVRRKRQTTNTGMKTVIAGAKILSWLGANNRIRLTKRRHWQMLRRSPASTRCVLFFPIRLSPSLISFFKHLRWWIWWSSYSSFQGPRTAHWTNAGNLKSTLHCPNLWYSS